MSSLNIDRQVTRINDQIKKETESMEYWRSVPVSGISEEQLQERQRKADKFEEKIKKLQKCIDEHTGTIWLQKTLRLEIIKLMSEVTEKLKTDIDDVPMSKLQRVSKLNKAVNAIGSQFNRETNCDAIISEVVLQIVKLY